MSIAEIARNMTQSPDNWPSRDVKAVAQSHGDLLAVCREFMACLGPNGYHPGAGAPATQRMRAAINKAEGLAEGLPEAEGRRTSLPLLEGERK